MFTSRNYLHFYLQADMVMNRGYFKNLSRRSYCTLWRQIYHGVP